MIQPYNEFKSIVKELDLNLFKEIVSSEGLNYQENYEMSRKRTVIDQNEFAQIKAKFESNVSNTTDFTELYLQDCYRPSLKTNLGEFSCHQHQFSPFIHYRHLAMIIIKTLFSC